MFAEFVHTDQYLRTDATLAQPGHVGAELGMGDTEVETRDVAVVLFQQHRGKVIVGVDERRLLEDGFGAGDEARQAPGVC